MMSQFYVARLFEILNILNWKLMWSWLVPIVWFENMLCCCLGSNKSGNYFLWNQLVNIFWVHQCALHKPKWPKNETCRWPQWATNHQKNCIAQNWSVDHFLTNQTKNESISRCFQSRTPHTNLTDECTWN